MSSDTTFNDACRAEALEGVDAGFVMDEEYFRGFYDRNARRLWAYLVRITGSREMADDLLQETFYRFLRAGAAHHSEEHRRNSLYRIATNLARDSRRRSSVRMETDTRYETVEELPAADQAGVTERMTDFTRAMSELEPRERAMLWLAYAEGASHREIASVLGLKTASLKPLLYRARQKMAALLNRVPKGCRS